MTDARTPDARTTDARRSDARTSDAGTSDARASNSAGQFRSGPVPDVRSDESADRRARIWLSRAIEPGRASVYRYVHADGAVEVAARLRAAADSAATAPERRSGPGVDVRAGDEQVDDDLRRAGAIGMRFVTPADKEWPAQALRPMEAAVLAGRDDDAVADLAPPLGLWVRGPARLDEALGHCVSIVGSRASTAYGEHVAAEFAYGLAEQGWTVVSGGAYGIDGAAHRGALAAGGMTVAILAGGLDSPYPRGHRTLFDHVLQAGLLVGEWPAGCAPFRHRFLVRNRLIAAVGAGTIVVEAGVRSGALATARRAKRIGRSLMTVPGPVTSAMSVGCHELLRDERARVVTRVGEVLEEIGRIGELATPRRAPVGLRDGLDPMAGRVLDGVPLIRAAPVERIAHSCGLPVTDLLRVLPLLELRDLVERRTDGWRLSERARLDVGIAARPAPTPA